MNPNDQDTAIELPVFARATYIVLSLPLHLTLPVQGGEFLVLERLRVSNCLIDMGALISRCPRLRALRVTNYRSQETIVIHSTTIEELHLRQRFNQMWGDIQVPLIKNLSWRHYFEDGRRDFAIMINRSWRLNYLKLETQKRSSVVLRLDLLRHVVRVLSIAVLASMKLVDFIIVQPVVISFLADYSLHFLIVVITSLMTRIVLVIEVRFVATCHNSSITEGVLSYDLHALTETCTTHAEHEGNIPVA